MAKLKEQRVCYLPGSFWKSALEEITSNFVKNGLANFRREIVNLYFFVPTYGQPGNGFTLNTIESLKQTLDPLFNEKQKKYLELTLDGSFQALADYRTFLASNLTVEENDLKKFSESKIGNPIEHFSFDNRHYSRSSLNYLLGLTFLKKIDPNFFPKKVLEIGGGFGTLAEIIGKTFEKRFTYINADLPPMFKIAEAYVKSCFKEKESFFDDFSNPSGEIQIEELPSYSFLPNWRIEDLRGEIDLFVNFISFQEMEPEIVQNYVQIINKLSPKYVLLRNLREGQQKKKNGSFGVTNPILKEDYITFFKDFDFVESNLLPFGFKTVDGFHSELMILRKK